jgi:hypothetical protein
MKWFGCGIIGMLVLLTAQQCLALPKAQRYAVAEIATPVLNTPDFQNIFGGLHGNTLKVDTCGQIAELEFVALPKTVFKVVDVLKRGGRMIYKVTSDEYPYPEPRGYYVDSRFVRLVAVKPPPRQRELPSREQIIERLLAAQGAPYVWGGNLTRGVPQMLLFYPPATPLRDRDLMAHWLMAGVDCSGLLYAATDGFTPRNTTGLLTYGQSVPIAGLSVDEIIARVQPLDLIVWKGHVMIILDQERVIESRPDCQGRADGVRLAALQDVLKDILARRMPVDEHCANADLHRKSFVIRRWFGVATAREVRPPGVSVPGGFQTSALR